MVGIEDKVKAKNGETFAKCYHKKLREPIKPLPPTLWGLYCIDRIAPDDYKIEASAPGFTIQSVIHHISREKLIR